MIRLDDWGNRQPLTWDQANNLANRLRPLGLTCQVYRSGYGEECWGVRIHGLGSQQNIAAYYNCRNEDTVFEDVKHMKG